MNGQRMYDFIKSFDFVRVSGTAEELRGAEMIQAECASFGFETQIESFPTEDGEVIETQLEVLEPYKKVYEARAFRRSACIDDTAEVKYAEDGLPVNLLGCEGKILLLNVNINRKKYEALMAAKPAAVIVGEGDMLDRNDETDLQPGMLRPFVTEGIEGRLCAVTVRKKDLYDMIVSGASKMRLKVVARDFENTSRNVIGTIPGTRDPDQVIAFTAHMDSTQFSHGCYDNAAGSANLLELARYYTKNPPARTLRFIWTGSEERGLLGSKYFVSAHKEEVENTRLCVNIDLAGSPAGKDFAIVTGPSEITNHIDMTLKEAGHAAETRTDTYSSDCIPYADNGVPAVSLGRFGAPGMSYIHSRKDRLEYVSASSLENTGKMVELLVDRFVNAACLPFERTIPDDIKKKVDEYLLKK